MDPVSKAENILFAPHNKTNNQHLDISMKRKRSVSLDLLLNRPIAHATEVSKTKIKTIETYLRNRFKCIEVLLHVRFPKELVHMILELWRGIFQITQQPSWRASRGNTARNIFEWSQWYLGRRVNFREVGTLFFSMFQDWREQDKKVVFSGSGSGMMLIRKQTQLRAPTQIRRYWKWLES